jgi:alkylhydroperoxidase family enzyme
MAIISSLEKNQAAEIIKNIYQKFEEEGKNIPEWVKVMAHRPEILKEFFELFRIVMGPGKIEGLLKWKIAYTVSDTLKCPFCVDVTIKMMKTLGATEKEIEEMKKSGIEKEKYLLDMVKEVTKEAQVCNQELFSKLKDNFSEEQIVEIVSIIGLFNYINRFNNTFCILPE